MARPEMPAIPPSPVAQVARDESAVVVTLMRKAFTLGQIYWQQLDSGNPGENRKAEKTCARFHALLDGARALLGPQE